GEPTRLQLQLGWNSRRGKQRALANAVSVAHLCVTICERRHVQIMKNSWPNVTCSVISAFRVAHASRVLASVSSRSRTFPKALRAPGKRDPKGSSFQRDAETRSPRRPLPDRIR